MSYFARLDLMLKKTREICNDAEIRFATIDWEEEFSRMDDDEEYTPIPFLNDGEFYDALECPETQVEGDERDAKRFMEMMKLSSCGVEPDRKLVEYVGTIMQIKSKIITLYKTKLREEFVKEDWDLRPSMYCSTCNVFANSVSKFRDHECKETTKCNHCGKQEKTYERLQNHIQAKHLKTYKHSCKECEYSTDSQKEYERHTNSKAHKQKCGIKLEMVFYPCNDCCVKPFAFPSELKRHMRTCKGKK